MKATGIVRRVDILGRMVIPIEIRRELGVEFEQPLEIFTEEDSIILKKYTPSCVLCDGEEETTEYKGKPVCRKCISLLQQVFR